MKTIPISAIVPTRNRPTILGRTLESLAAQEVFPAELIVIDGSEDVLSRQLVEEYTAQSPPDSKVIWLAATELGAAAQRNQGVAIATQPIICFFDDDILFEPGCLERLWTALQRDTELGGVNATILNQQYGSPGRISRSVFRLLHGKDEQSYAGKCIGPAVNLLPEDRPDLPEVVPVEWLNLGCTLYRREALPEPVFPGQFTGYSLMEDLTLSLVVGRHWKLANARTARIFHDSQPGSHKENLVEVTQMQLVNRHFVMTEILGQKRFVDYLRLFMWEAFQLVVCVAQRQSRPTIGAMLRGKWRAFRDLNHHSTPAK